MPYVTILNSFTDDQIPKKCKLIVKFGTLLATLVGLALAFSTANYPEYEIFRITLDNSKSSEFLRVCSIGAISYF